MFSRFSLPQKKEHTQHFDLQDVWAELKYEPREGSEEQDWTKAIEAIVIFFHRGLLTFLGEKYGHSTWILLFGSVW